MSAGSIQSRFGTTQLPNGRTRFRLWAPAITTVKLEIEGRPPVHMASKAGGWFEADDEAGPEARYRFRLSDDLVVADPAAKAQGSDVHDPSVVVDRQAYVWRNSDWKGRPWEEAVIYEAHAGLMGGFNGVAEQLLALAALGVTAVELMPIADFPGRRNWGYDGVLPFAPDCAYGTPDDLKALVDRAHDLGVMIFLDVVYNHFGPDGNYLPVYAPEIFRKDLQTPWGGAIDFRRPEVRTFFTENAIHWVGEYRFDGLRFDAVHAISERDWLVEMAQAVRAAAPDRHIHLILENENNAASLLGEPFDAQWNDDFHNVMHVLLTGEKGAYYQDFSEDSAEKLARCLKEGFIYQGEASPHNGKPRGEPSAGLSATAFVAFLQNHDQVGNRALGERLTLLAEPEALKAATALLLLCPQIPLLFMGEEIGSTSPFLFFTDFHDELADAVREGRRKEFAKFPAFADPDQRRLIPDPNAASTFEQSKPQPNAQSDQWRAFYKDLLDLRRRFVIPRLKGARGVRAEAIGEKAVIAAWSMTDGAILTLALNLADTAVELLDTPKSLPFHVQGAAPNPQLQPHSLVAWLEEGSP